jgi:hypothetical protein
MNKEERKAKQMALARRRAELFAELWGVNIEMLRGKRKTQDLAWARAVGCWCLHQAGHTYEELTAAFHRLGAGGGHNVRRVSGGRQHVHEDAARASDVVAKLKLLQ